MPTYNVTLRGARKRLNRFLQKVGGALDGAQTSPAEAQAALAHAVRTPVWAARRGELTVSIEHREALALATRLTDAAQHWGISAKVVEVPAGAPNPITTARYVHGQWEHIFHEHGPATRVRVVLDAHEEKLVAMHVHNESGWHNASAAEISDVQDSLLNTNDVLADPAQCGLATSWNPPSWMLRDVARVRATASAQAQHAGAKSAPRGLAHYITEVTVTDPDSNAPVEVAVYKDPVSGGMFAVDSSFLLTLSDDDPVIEPFNGREVLLWEGPLGSPSAADSGEEPGPGTLMFQPDAEHMPEDLASFEVFVSLERAKERYPEIPLEAWQAYRYGDIEHPVFVDRAPRAPSQVPAVYEVDVAKLAKPGASTVSDLRLAVGLGHTGWNTTTDLLVTEVAGQRYALRVVGTIEGRDPNNEASFDVRSITQEQLAQLEGDAQAARTRRLQTTEGPWLEWITPEGEAVGDVFDEIALDPNEEIRKLQRRLEAPGNEPWRDVVGHVLHMQEKYEFVADGDDAREAIERSAELLGIELTNEQTVAACQHLEEENAAPTPGPTGPVLRP